MKMPTIKHWNLIDPVLRVLEQEGFEAALLKYRGIAGRLYSYEAEWVWLCFDDHRAKHEEAA